MKRALFAVLVLLALVVTGAAYADLPPPDTAIESPCLDTLPAGLATDVPQADARMRGLPALVSAAEPHESFWNTHLLADMPITDSGASDDAPVRQATSYEGAVHDHRKIERTSGGFWLRE